MMVARPGSAQKWLPVLVAPFVALMSRSNQLRRVVSRGASTGPAKAQSHPNSTQAGSRARPALQLRALFAHSLLCRQLPT